MLLFVLLSGRLNNIPSYDLHFWRRDIGDIVQSVSSLSLPSINNLTVSLWMKTSVYVTVTLFGYGNNLTNVFLKLQKSGDLAFCVIHSSPKCK